MFTDSGTYGSSCVNLLCHGAEYRFDPSTPPIGIGGMGIVYLGFRVSDNKKVAVKMLRPELSDIPAFRLRAKLEAGIQVHNPNIVKMLGYCECNPDHGPLYVLSEYVEGIPFQEYVKHQLSHLSPRERVVRIVSASLPVLKAVAYLHSIGIIHRDIKPDNLMLQNDNSLILLDLGVAKCESFYDAHLQGTIGTEPFCAPEQVVPDNVEASTDYRSDIYSCGMTLAFLISGWDHSALKQTDPDLYGILRIATRRLPAM